MMKVCLRQGESLNWENFNNRICVLVLQGSIVVFGRHGKMLFRLNAGEANVFEGTPECTGNHGYCQSITGAFDECCICIGYAA